MYVYVPDEAWSKDLAWTRLILLRSNANAYWLRWNFAAAEAVAAAAAAAVVESDVDDDDAALDDDTALVSTQPSDKAFANHLSIATQLHLANIFDTEKRTKGKKINGLFVVNESFFNKSKEENFIDIAIL